MSNKGSGDTRALKQGKVRCDRANLMVTQELGPDSGSEHKACGGARWRKVK
jgi:hypothetical protein